MSEPQLDLAGELLESCAQQIRERIAPGLPAARVTDPETSKAAATSMRTGGAASSHRQKILAALEAFGRQGATYVEIAFQLGMPPVAVNRRLHELREAQLVVRLDLTRKTPSGCPAHVYVRNR